jgi:hypothetical protein
MRFLRQFSIISFLFMWAFGSQAEICSYTAFTPQPVFHYLAERFSEMRIALVPNSGACSAVNVSANNLLILHDSTLLGQMRYIDDVRSGRSELLVFDAYGAPLASMIQTTQPCPQGDYPSLCRKTELWTELDSIAGSPAPFAVEVKSGHVRYFRYGKESNVSAWRYEFNDAVQWVINSILNNNDVRLIHSSSMLARFTLALASDPVVVAYLPWISIYSDRGHLVVSGRLPSTAVHSLILSHALDLGLYKVKMNTIIDSGLRSVGDHYRRYGSCYRG